MDSGSICAPGVQQGNTKSFKSHSRRERVHSFFAAYAFACCYQARTVSLWVFHKRFHVHISVKSNRLGIAKIILQTLVGITIWGTESLDEKKKKNNLYLRLGSWKCNIHTTFRIKEYYYILAATADGGWVDSWEAACSAAAARRFSSTFSIKNSPAYKTVSHLTVEE